MPRISSELDRKLAIRVAGDKQPDKTESSLRMPVLPDAEKRQRLTVHEIFQSEGVSLGVFAGRKATRHDLERRAGNDVF